MPEATFVDWNRDFRRLRLVRSEEEIAFFHVAAELTDRSIDRLARELRPGLHESELAALVNPQEACNRSLESACDFVFRSGMVVTLQPQLMTLDRRIGLQFGETIVIRNTGVERLHRYPRQMIICLRWKSYRRPTRILLSVGVMLSVRRLSRRFQVAEGTVTALKELSFEVNPGEFFVLVGASGSGKTTLLRCVAGLEVPDGGEVRIDGRIMSSDAPPTFVPPQQRRLGMVFQSYAVWPHLTVYENVALPLREGTQRIARGEVDRQVRQVLEMVELDSLAERSATLLSGGQQQRVALARAIAVNSRMLLMDEPLSNLDARLREEVRGRIRELAKRLGSTVVYVTHDQVEAMAMADRIALLRLGELLQVGTPVELYRHPREPFIAEFFGQVNWLEGRSLGGDRVETPIGDLLVAARAPAGQPVLLGIRPESLVLVENDVVNSFEARLVSSAFLGDQVHGQLAIADRVLAAKGRALLALPGTIVRVAIDPAEVMLFPDGTPPHLANAIEAREATALEPLPTPA